MKRLAALVLLVTGPSMAVNAQTTPTLNPATGHSYLVVKGSGANGNITWDNAKAAAAVMIDRDLNGHLATITSQAEFDFVDDLRQKALMGTTPVITQGQVWIGGSQPSGQSTPGAGWLWENDEGAIPGTNTEPLFAKWANGEPNDAPVTGEQGTEQHLTLGRYPSTGTGKNLGFNDEGSNLSSIGGYIVEFEGGTVPGATCTDQNAGDAGTELGCNPSGVVRYFINQNLGTDTFVTAGLVRPDPDIKAVVDPQGYCGEFAYRDPRVSVDLNGIPTSVRAMSSLDVFDTLRGTASDGEPLNPGVLILDKNTFGSPCFAVVKGSTFGFEINTGTVLGTQLAESVPEIGNVYSCNRTQLNGSTQGDLQRRTQYTYMTTDPSGMAEGGAAAMTASCQNPTTSTTKKKSFDVLNTHESCGIIVSDNPTTIPTAVRLCFEGLANTKFNLLDGVLENSKGALNSPKYSDLDSKVNQARSLLKQGQYQKSQNRLNEFLAMAKVADYDLNTENYQGDLIMRANNLLFRLQELKCPKGTKIGEPPTGLCAP